MSLSSFKCSEAALKVLKGGNILGVGETPEEMIDRVVLETFRVEAELFKIDLVDIKVFINKLRHYIIDKSIVPSTPILTNCGSTTKFPLSACVVPDIDLNMDKALLKQKIDQLHIEGMGTGFNFSGLEDPFSIVHFLNNIAEDGQISGKQNRPVGNMGVMNVYDKHIMKFIKLKTLGTNQGINWKFNFSVDIDKNFINAFHNSKDIQLSDGTFLSPSIIIDAIAKNAYDSGDPGIVFLDKMNESNLLGKAGNYIATAPCGEVGLSSGEACQFASLNLSCFIKTVGKKTIIDYEKIKDVTHLIVRFLDDMLEYSIRHYSDYAISKVMSYKRKIGVGVCGFADMLVKLGIAYDSSHALQTAEDIMSYINYESKIASIELAKTRGSFLGFQYSLFASVLHDFSYAKKYSYPTTLIPQEKWNKIDALIKKHGIRHISTIALPPTGRSSIVFDTSPQIEPLFNLKNYDFRIRKDLLLCLKDQPQKEELHKKILSTGSCQSILFDKKAVYKTSTEILPIQHIKMLESFQKFTDEAVSKTINLPRDIPIEEVKKILIYALNSKYLKGITIYRDGSRSSQPVDLK